MSDQYYENMRDKTAAPLIKKYGMEVTLTRTIPGTPDPKKGNAGTPTTAEYTCYVVQEDYDDSMLARSLVKSGEKKLLVSAEGLSSAPIIGDKFTMPDGIWFIPDGDGGIPPVRTLAPGGIAIMYTVRVRQ